MALTGAGISTLSNIPDFRGKNGLYTAGLPMEKVFDIDEFEGDPAYFYTNAGSMVYTVHEKEPSIVHTCLAELERWGTLKAVITQNIDMLHQKAGSQRVIEVHGSPRMHYCLRCAGVRVSYAEAAALVKDGDMPRCPKCGRTLKPAITFYGESLPLEARREAEGEAQDADVMLILGSCLTVMPAAAIPRTTLQRGGRLVIVNDMRTPLDDDAAMRFWDLEEVFKGLGKLLDSLPGPL
ncbi:NAD-dependent protein deacetylase [Spirochaetia bacterium]|nr:NAD-dependent protein deacetylase [Spirochaetia bacterium]